MNGQPIRTADCIWVIDGDSHTTKWVREQGRIDYDRTTDRLCELIPVGGFVVDAGASIGDQAVPFARKVGTWGRVFAFEPHPVAFECLRRNTVMYSLPQVWLYQIALTANGGQHRIVTDTENFGESYLTSYASGKGIVVSSVRLDDGDDKDRLPRFDFFKLDVEGMEPGALAGARRLIEKFKPLIYCEVNDKALERQGTDRQKLFALLDDLGYSYSPFTGQFSDTQFDILCRPK